MTLPTIIALATAPIKSGVAVLRVSGEQAPSVLSALGVTLPRPREATLATLRHPQDRSVIDRALVLYFPAPHSFTGEDVVELHVHGSRAVTHALLSLITTLPSIRLAEAGEFSRRAFLNGKMDLVEAEGLADLIDAETRAQMQQALRQMQGEVGAAYESLRGRIIHIMALLEAYIDFPDEDIPPHVVSQAGKEITSLITHIRGLLDDNHRAERLREGIEIVILGAPNAGKSTLLNALAKREVAIVSPIAGTTRDVLEVHLDLAGYPVTLIDTAGLHELEEKGDATRIEAEGMRRARDRAANAALVLELFATGTLPEHYSNSLGLEAKNYLLVRSKCDLASAKTSTEHHGEILAISAQNGEGIESLLQLLSQHIAQIYHAQEPSIITRTRHRTALTHCLKHLEQYQSLKPLELNAEHLRLGARELASITGHISVDHVLDVVFSSFCIGK